MGFIYNDKDVSNLANLDIKYKQSYCSIFDLLEIKEYLGIDFDYKDNIIKIFLTEACDKVERYINKSLSDGEYTAIYTKMKKDNTFLPYYASEIEYILVDEEFLSVDEYVLINGSLSFNKNKHYDKIEINYLTNIDDIVSSCGEYAEIDSDNPNTIINKVKPFIYEYINYRFFDDINEPNIKSLDYLSKRPLF